MSIKSAHVIRDVVCAVKLDKLLADLDAGNATPEAVKSVLSEVRRTFDIPTTTCMTEDEQAEVLIAALQGSDDPLAAARNQMTQDFFANANIPVGVRKQVAAFLVKRFGDRGNPLWASYLNGTFRYFNVESLDA